MSKKITELEDQQGGSEHKRTTPQNSVSNTSDSPNALRRSPGFRDLSQYVTPSTFSLEAADDRPGLVSTPRKRTTSHPTPAPLTIQTETSSSDSETDSPPQLSAEARQQIVDALHNLSIVAAKPSAPTSAAVSQNPQDADSPSLS